MSNKPWLDLPDLFKDEKAFCQWLRSASRAAWTKHPIRIRYIQERRQKLPVGKKTKSNPEGMVWACQCELCGEYTRKPQTDHKIQCGSTGSVAEWLEWIEKLLILGFDDIQLLCKKCHDIKSYQDRTGLDWDSAKSKKDQIAFGKTDEATQRKILQAAGIEPSKTKSGRLKQYKQLTGE